MLKIKDTKIALTRGDSAYITLTILDKDGRPVEIGEDDIIRCQVRETVNGGELIFEGDIEKVRDEYIWHIKPDDTRHREVKNYVWDAQLEYPNGDIFTFIKPSLFKLMDEVTMIDDDF